VIPMWRRQPPRRVLASRRLLFSAVGVPRFNPRPKRKRGRGSKRGDESSRWSLLARWRRLVLGFVSVSAVHIEIAVCDFKNQSSYEVLLAAEPSTGEWL
jgi:hypothetical protein